MSNFKRGKYKGKREIAWGSPKRFQDKEHFISHGYVTHPVSESGNCPDCREVQDWWEKEGAEQCFNRLGMKRKYYCKKLKGKHNFLSFKKEKGWLFNWEEFRCVGCGKRKVVFERK